MGIMMRMIMLIHLLLTYKWVHHHPHETTKPYKQHRHVPLVLYHTAALPDVPTHPELR